MGIYPSEMQNQHGHDTSKTYQTLSDSYMEPQCPLEVNSYESISNINSVS